MTCRCRSRFREEKVWKRFRSDSGFFVPRPSFSKREVHTQTLVVMLVELHVLLLTALYWGSGGRTTTTKSSSTWKNISSHRERERERIVETTPSASSCCTSFFVQKVQRICLGGGDYSLGNRERRSQHEDDGKGKLHVVMLRRILAVKEGLCCGSWRRDLEAKKEVWLEKK